MPDSWDTSYAEIKDLYAQARREFTNRFDPQQLDPHFRLLSTDPDRLFPALCIQRGVDIQNALKIADPAFDPDRYIAWHILIGSTTNAAISPERDFPALHEAQAIIPLLNRIVAGTEPGFMPAPTPPTTLPGPSTPGTPRAKNGD